MKNLLTQFNVSDIRKANEQMKARNSHNGRFGSVGQITLKAGSKEKVISTKVNKAQIREAWGKVTSRV